MTVQCRLRSPFSLAYLNDLNSNVDNSGLRLCDLRSVPFRSVRVRLRLPLSVKSGSQTVVVVVMWDVGIVIFVADGSYVTIRS